MMSVKSVNLTYYRNKGYSLSASIIGQVVGSCGDGECPLVQLHGLLRGEVIEELTMFGAGGQHRHAPRLQIVFQPAQHLHRVQAKLQRLVECLDADGRQFGQHLLRRERVVVQRWWVHYICRYIKQNRAQQTHSFS